MLINQEQVTSFVTMSTQDGKMYLGTKSFARPFFFIFSELQFLPINLTDYCTGNPPCQILRTFCFLFHLVPTHKEMMLAFQSVKGLLLLNHHITHLITSKIETYEQQVTC